MPEQFTLKQVFIQSSTVDLHKSPVTSAAGEVNSMSNQLFSRPRFATYEHCRVTDGHLVDLAIHIAHRIRIADYVLRPEPALKLVT